MLFGVKCLFMSKHLNLPSLSIKCPLNILILIFIKDIQFYKRHIFIKDIIKDILCFLGLILSFNLIIKNLMKKILSFLVIFYVVLFTMGFSPTKVLAWHGTVDFQESCTQDGKIDVTATYVPPSNDPRTSDVEYTTPNTGLETGDVVSIKLVEDASFTEDYTVTNTNSCQPTPKRTDQTCPFTSSSTTTVVNFDPGEEVWTGGPETTSNMPVSLDAGTYKVSLYSWDGYNGRETVSQPNEQWYVSFLDGSSEVAQSGSSTDLADNVIEADSTDIVNTNLVLNQSVDGVVGTHVAPTTTANSVYPVCASFEKQANPTPTTGSIKVCKIVTDSSDNPVAGDSGSTFTIPFVDESYEGANNGVPSAVTFTTPLTLEDLPFGVQGQCETVSNLDLGRYYYGDEQISDSSKWETPLYNDGASADPSSLSDFAELNTNSDSQYDNNDGVINISSSTPSRTLYVLNKMKEQPKQCDVVSDSTNIVENSNTAAVELSSVHSSWVSSISNSLAKWIWSEEPVSDPTSDKTEIFTKKFNVGGNVTSANIQMAADNGYKLEINGNVVVDNLSTSNYSSLQGPVDVSSYLVDGENTIKFTVKNFKQVGGTTESNPAGLLYDLTVKSDSCSLINNSNQAPTADAGPDQTITLPTDTTSLDGSGSSDSDGTVTDFKWTQTSGPNNATFDDDTSDTPNLSDLIEGTYTFELTVTDNDGATATDTVDVVVNPANSGGNSAPTADAGPDQTITLPTDTTSLDGSGSSDSDGTVTDFKWTQTSGPNNATFDDDTSDTPNLSDLIEGTYTFELTVTDNDGATATDTVDVVVNPEGNHIVVGSSVRGGEVLGATTTCGIYIEKYLRKGYSGNDPEQVKKLQQFLNDYMGVDLKVDGIYGDNTEAAVKAFQLKHADEILTPWGLTQPTGIFYLTTQTVVNNIMCPDLGLTHPNLVPWSNNSNL